MAEFELSHDIWDTVRVEKRKPTGGRTVGHAFAKVMYDVCQILGVFREGSKQRDIRAYASFWRHQEFFKKRYNEIIEIIDEERLCIEEQKELIKEERRSLFYKYEMFYNQIMFYPVFSTLSRDQLFERYIQLGVSSCLALDIHKNLSTTNNSGFYFHIHKFLSSEHCPTLDNSERDISLGVRNYLREPINKINDPQKHLLPVFERIRDIRKKSTTTKFLMNSEINQCIKRFKRDLDEGSFKVVKDTLVNFKESYLPLRSLLALDRRTGLVKNLSSAYLDLKQKDEINDGYYSALHQYLYESKYFDEGLLEIAVEEFQKKTTDAFSIEIDRNAWLNIKIIWHLVFSPLKGDVFTELDLVDLIINLKNSPNAKILTPYLTLSKAIHSICIDNLAEAEQIINTISLNKLPLGFISAAISIIKTAINIKLNGKEIKNGQLLSNINTILTYQGVFTDYSVISPDQKRPDFSLILCANNLTIMRTIKMYNNMIQMISCYNELEPSVIHPQSITGFMDEVEHALKKINKRLDTAPQDINSQELATLIVDEKILTTRECSQNLVSYLDEFTLYNCILNLNNLRSYLTLPGEGLVNIIEISGNSSENEHKRELIAESIRIANDMKGRTKPQKEGEKARKRALIIELSRGNAKTE
ncbi:TPA: hypothetical protein KEV01_001156 [Citrobacter koseri]|nr:hypothetical protein [Citrobacter koseri]